MFLPGEFHRQKSLAGYSSWGHKESDMTEWLTTHTRAGETLVPDPFAVTPIGDL